MNVEHNPLPDLMALGYEAAIEPALWPEVVLGTARAFDAAVVGFGVVDRRRDRDVFSFWNDNDFVRGASAFYPTPRSNPAASFAAQTQSLTIANGLMSSREMESLDFFNEVMRPRALWETMAVNLHRDEATLAPMVLFGSARGHRLARAGATRCTRSRRISIGRCGSRCGLKKWRRAPTRLWRAPIER
jgi:hypothetical protein